MKNLFTNFSKTLTLTLFLILGFGNTWADEAGVFYSYFEYNINGTNHTISREYYNTDNATEDVGIVTSSFSFEGIYIKVWNNSGKGNICGGHMAYSLNGTWSDKAYYTNDTWSDWGVDGVSNRRQISKVASTAVASSTDPSGTYSIPYYWHVWGDKSGTSCNGSFDNNNNGYNFHFTYTILPPDVETFSVSASNSVDGTGDEDDPFIIQYGSTTAFTVTATKAHSDANSKLNVSFDNGVNWSEAADATTTTVTSGSYTPDGTKRSITIQAKHTNSDASLDCATGAEQTIYYIIEPRYNVTAVYGDGGKAATPASATPFGQYTGGEITATAYPGYYFSGWTIESGAGTFTSTALPSTTFKPTAASTVQANFERTYAFVEGRFRTREDSPTGSWTTIGGAGWETGSTDIPVRYDKPNHRFALHTYATPAELSAQIASNDPWFYIVVSRQPAGFYRTRDFKPSSNQTLSNYGEGNGAAVSTASSSYNVKFNSSDDANGYAVLCFDESKIWYELECALTYNANEGTGDAPASRTYYAYNSNQTAAANTFTKNGYIFTGWNTEANGSGTAYAPGASVSMNAKEVTLYAQWIAEGAIDCWDGNEYKCGSIPNFNTPKPGSTTWSGATWGGGEAPTSETTVVLQAPMTVSSGTAYAKKVALTGSTATLTIDNGAALVITDNITKNGAAPTASDLALGGSASGNATLIFNNNNSAAATVGTYSIASTTPTWTWQYVAVPFSVSTSSYSGAQFYAWTSDGWSEVTSGSLSPWTTYCMTQESATGYSPSGTLEATDTQGDVTFSTYQTGDAAKYVLCSNSWTAPIQIRQIEASDIGDSDKTIWLFNTGLDPEGTGTVSESASAAGTYLSIPINAASYIEDKISSLQSFIVKTSLTLNYTKHVRPSGGNSVVNPAMHAPKQMTENEPTVVKLNVSGSRYADQLLLLEREDFTSGYDTGWDGEKLDETTTAPQLFTLREDGTPDAVSAIPELETTPIAFRAGEDTQYTMSFTYDGEEDLYLIDTENNNASTLISNENTYTFTTSSKKATPRFTISRAPQIATDVENAQSDDAQCTKARKLMLDGQLYLMYKGTMYNVQGAVIK